MKMLRATLLLGLIVAAAPALAESPPETDPVCGGPLEAGRRSVDGSPQLEHLDYLIGIWRVTSYSRDDSGEFVAIPGYTCYRARWLYDGHGVQAEYYSNDPTGFYSNSVISWNESRQEFTVQFTNAKRARTIGFTARAGDGGLVVTNRGGYAGKEDYLYRETDRLREDGTVVKSIDRSDDDAATWTELSYRFEMSPIRLSSTAIRGAPAWFPEGDAIVYNLEDERGSTIHRSASARTEPVRLSTHPSDERHPSISPDGTRLLFLSRRDGNREVYTMDINGGNPRRLTHTEDDEAAPSWSADGERIYFGYNLESRRAIHVMQADGSDARRISRANFDVIYPQESPDGRRLVVTARPSGQGQSYQIFTMNPDGSEMTQLTDEPAPHYNASWSPDGTRIVFVRQQRGDITTAQIYTIAADGSDLRQLTHSSNGCFQPRWSPDGTRILFRHGWTDDHLGLFTVTTTGEPTLHQIP